MQKRNEVLVPLIKSYLFDKEKEHTWQSVSSMSAYSRGMLVGACMVYELDIDETDECLQLITRKSKKVALKVDKPVVF